MTHTKLANIALLGNPNSGKSSLFNFLTGLRQNVSNFPGVTVDKKSGTFVLENGKEVNIIDFPGTYSLYPNSSEEKIVINTLTNPNDENYPDLVVYVADATQLERHLLFATQILDLGFKMVFVLNMVDLVPEYEKNIHTEILENYLGTKVVSVSVRNELYMEDLRSAINKGFHSEIPLTYNPTYKLSDVETFVAIRISKLCSIDNLYRAKDPSPSL